MFIHSNSESVTKTKNFWGALQDNVSKRIEKSYRKDIPVTYEITNDIALLHQYFSLRNDMYFKAFKVAGHDWGEDSYDKISYIIIARRGNLCLGGCRLIIRECDEQWALPMEDNNFKLREAFPDLKLNKVRHAEISRFAVMDDCGEANVLDGLYKELYKLVTNSNIRYIFVKSTYAMARKWRFVSNSFGVKTTKILENIHPANDLESSDIKWYLTLSDLSSFCTDSEDEPVTKVFPNKISEELN